ncbi:cyclase family protein [Fusobacterium sp.]|uniref:cyclase family protein n=1 Tax=Fusobacterium sp. TaxID=68766 RepID=UPI002902ABEF|nr:cyclase family protein [Fusobacterium sp.]MDU1912036.1 cyclase family protein [Fusobacterium sp.]
MKIYDLTHKIENNMPVYCEMEKPDIKQLFSYKKDGVNIVDLGLTSHLGTHLDTPFHILENGKNICDFSIDTFFGKGLCIFFKNLDTLDFKLLKNIDYLLIYTGWDKYWNEEKYFKNYPVISKRSAEKIANSHLKGIGIDCISPDSYVSKELENHNILLKSDKIIVENLCKLENLLEKEFYFSCMPLKIAVDGCPIRAIAIEM